MYEGVGDDAECALEERASRRDVLVPLKRAIRKNEKEEREVKRRGRKREKGGEERKKRESGCAYIVEPLSRQNPQFLLSWMERNGPRQNPLHPLGGAGKVAEVNVLNQNALLFDATMSRFDRLKDK